MVSKNELLAELPPFTNHSVIIEKKQEVNDIIREVLEAHKYFAEDYDFIYSYFDAGSIDEICKRIFDFCKKNILYEIEKEDRQTTKSPAAILSIAKGDCKHYAGFIAGILDAISRNTNKKIDWDYRFANYSYFNKEMQHVFVVVFDGISEIWIDPVLNFFNSRNVVPVSYIDKKAKVMLARISGMGLIAPDLSEIPISYGSNYLQTNAQTLTVNLPAPVIAADDYYSQDIDPVLEDHIKQLLYYGIIDSDMNIHNDIYMKTIEALQQTDADILSNAYGYFLNQAQINASAGIIGSIFSSIWGTVKQVSLSIPRGAYLSLVSLNVFNLAYHLNKCITNADGSTDQAGIDKLQGVWHKKLSGDTNLLLRAIRNGANKKAILGIDGNIIGVAPVAAAWAVTAAVIIAAMTPIVTSVLKSKNQFSSMAASQLAMQPTANGTPIGSSSLTQNLPLLLIGGAGIYLLMSKKKK